MHGSTFVADLAIVLCVAAMTAVLARMTRQSTVLGYLAAGLVVGPYLPFPLFAHPDRVRELAEFGVVLVMFGIGLEFRVKRLLRVLPTSGLTAVVQVGFLIWCGYTLGTALGWDRVESLFLGTCIAISSTMVVSRVFEERAVARDVREFVLGVLVVQDVIAIVLIAAMTVAAAGGGVAPAELWSTLGRLIGVLLAMLVGGLFVVPRVIRIVTRLRSAEILVVVTIGLCFGMALLAEELGYSVALGAFIAGILVAESGSAGRIEPLLHPVRDIFAAVFFVSVGMSVDPRVAFDVLPTSLIIFAVVLFGQFGIVTLAGSLSGLGLRRSVTAGLALGQIGEFAFILAAIGVEAEVVKPSLQPVLITVAVLTAFTTPLLVGVSERAVHTVDALLPARLRYMLSLHEAWLERFRSSSNAQEGRPPRTRVLRALTVDGLALLVVLAIGVPLLPPAVGKIVGSFGVSEQAAPWLAGIALALLVSPMLAGIARNTNALAVLLGESIQERGQGPTSGGALATSLSRTLIVLAVLLTFGLPSIAIIRPLLGRSYGMGLLLLAFLVLMTRVWRKAGAIEVEYRSGATELAELLATQTHDDDPEHVNERVQSEFGSATLLPGLEAATTVPLPADGSAVGRTLAELDLRARSGGTVVAILRGDQRVVLPTGRERLESGDVLAIVGSREAVAKARRLLQEHLPAAAARRAP